MAIVALAASTTPASAADNWFAGRTVSIFVGSGAGGVYDIFARLVARHMGRFIPGEPSMIVQPMPGAGGVTASNYVYNLAAKDGTALGLVSPSLKVMEVAPGARYVSEKYNWIGRVVSTVNVTFTMDRSAVKNIDDARQKEATIAVTAPNAALSIFTRALNEAGGTKFKTIHGYVDANAAVLAAERGEVDGATISWNSLKTMRPQWLRDHKVNIIVQYAPWKHSQLPAVPNAVELGRTPQDRELLALFMSSADIGLSIMAPAEVPHDRVETLRAAFVAMMDDPDFKADAARLEPDFDPLAGDKLQQIVAESAHVSPQLMEKAKVLINGQ
jgi:tripartite-type tricarboxylate transporter receptor subunit TctC